MCQIGQCRHYSVLQADHGLLYRGLRKHVRPTGSQEKHQEMLEHQSLARQCSETESPHVCQSSTTSYTASVTHLKQVYYKNKNLVHQWCITFSAKGHYVLKLHHILSFFSLTRSRVHNCLLCGPKVRCCAHHWPTNTYLITAFAFRFEHLKKMLLTVPCPCDCKFIQYHMASGIRYDVQAGVTSCTVDSGPDAGPINHKKFSKCWLLSTMSNSRGNAEGQITVIKWQMNK